MSFEDSPYDDFYELDLCRDEIDQLKQQVATLTAERDELQAIFDMRWNADQRAIKRWQEATGKDNIWPDHADLCVWLLEQLDKAEARTATNC